MDFNPRSLTGATRLKPLPTTLRSFQSTLPHGSDRKSWALYVTDFYFNPRSLTGATSLLTLTIWWSSIFQSTLPHGSDSIIPLLLANYRIFQSTLPHGSDYLFLCRYSIAVGFQSTLPHGSDISVKFVYHVHANFNPRSLAGATECLTNVTLWGLISIHAPSRERQPHLSATAPRHGHFNPRSLAGATQ